MESWERELRRGGKSRDDAACREAGVLRTLEASRQALYENQEGQCLSFWAFLLCQAKYMRKRWWIAQAVILIVSGCCLLLSGGNVLAGKALGTAAPLLVVALIPELWRSLCAGYMEIEGAAYFSFRQVLTARLVLLGAADLSLLVLFLPAAAWSLHFPLYPLLVQFLLPFVLTCCVCFTLLGSGKHGSPYFAAAFSLLFAVIWRYPALLLSAWDKTARHIGEGLLLLALLYLSFALRRLLAAGNERYEEGLLWN